MTYLVDTSHCAKSADYRPKHVILHYTEMACAPALQRLTEGPVSAHYLVPEPLHGSVRTVYQLVKEADRAWHAGESYWQGRTHLNDSSIGIEIVNLGYQDQAGQRHWYPFPDDQIATVIALCQAIIARYQIAPTQVLGHSDVAPGRKVDPGPLFPWQTLYEAGVGAWPDAQAVAASMVTLADVPLELLQLQKDLAAYGYALSPTGQLDQQTKAAITALQMHFRPTDYSGKPDRETRAILQALLKKYRI